MGACRASALPVRIDVVDINDESGVCDIRRERRFETMLGSDAVQPVDQPYGQREYGARDLEGHRWWFASPLKAQR